MESLNKNPSKDPDSPSALAFERAKRVLAGGVNSPARAFLGVGGSPIFFRRAQGECLHSIDGDTYVDFVGSWGPMLLGHNHPKVFSAISEALHHGGSFGAPTILETEMAELVKKCFPSIEKVRMVNSGTEATLSAIRLARGATKKKFIIKFEGCYHGHGDSFLIAAGSAAATLEMENSSGVPTELSQLTLLARYNDLSSVEDLLKKHKNQVAAVIVEPVVGNMGLVPPKQNFLSALRKLTEEHEILLIFDEVMTGFRLSLGGAQELYGIKPDLTCLGKIIGGGLPVGAYGGREDLMNNIAPTGPVYQAGTLSGNPLAMAAGKATLSYLLENPQIYEELEKKGQHLADGLQKTIEKHHIKAFTQRVGSMITLFFNSKDKAIENYDHAKNCDTDLYARFFHGMLEKRFYLPPSQFEAAFLSTVMKQKHIDDFLTAADEVFQQISC